jgi:hypothetical protein
MELIFLTFCDFATIICVVVGGFCVSALLLSREFGTATKAALVVLAMVTLNLALYFNSRQPFIRAGLQNPL